MKKILVFTFLLFMFLASFLSSQEPFKDNPNDKKGPLEKSSTSGSKIIFSYFNLWPKMATLTYDIELEGETRVSVATRTQITKLKTEMRVKQWVAKTQDPKWIFEVFRCISQMAVTVNGVRTPLP